MFGALFSEKAAVDTTPEKIDELLKRGVEDVFIKETLEKKLRSGQRLRVKLGMDPTGSTIHVGRAITLWKLKQFQDLGHQVVFVVGDFTAQIGDASDKLSKRPMLAEADVKENLKNYKRIVGKIIDINKAEFVFNGSWLSKLTFREVCDLAETFSVQQMSSRRNFKDRIDKGEEVSLREFLYPLMQGYDSVMVNADIEIGGFDQLFNLKAGRTIQSHFSMPEQDILTTQMLEGTDGRKMSTSWGNVINITDEPGDMFGKIMSVRDDLIHKYFLLCTTASLSKIEDIKKSLDSGTNPRDVKLELAKEIVALYHSEEEAKKAEQDFINTFSKGGIPEEITKVEALKGMMLVDVLLAQKIVSSKTDWRRLVTENAVTNAETDEKIVDPLARIEDDATYKIGKRRFIRITVK
jgi:tyrosyl-tRNA synthetase